MAQALRIFISSPSDVSDERRRAALVIGRLKREFARFFDISAVLWEYEPMLSSGHFQDIIDSPATVDIVVLILWSRLGTPLPGRTEVREYKGLDGRVPVTGTEWEFEQALEAQQRRKGIPDLLVYRKFAEGIARFSRAEQLDQMRRQWDALQQFWNRHFQDQDGQFKAAFNRFVALDEFEAQVEQHLRELIRRRLPPQALRVTAKPRDRVEWWSGSPYRGLQAFDVEHSAVFFGREKAEREITEALAHRSGEGMGFMLVLGASGSGKSSLVRAGLLLNLMAPGVVQGVSTWRHAIVQTGELAPDPFAGLAAALLRPKALPELAAIGYQEAEIASQLRAGSTLAIAPLRLALERAAAGEAAAGAQRQGRIVLVLDQLEVLFTSADFTDAMRGAFDQLLSSLARSGLVLIIATLRSDFYHRLVELPALNALARGDGQYQLAGPTAGEIEQIIRHPAEAAGLSFEADPQSGIGLDAIIREAASHDPASLPLLSFVLDELYRRDIEAGGGNVLTYRTYQELGRLEGAIAHHAEALVERLPVELKAALPATLLALVEVDEVKGTATARTVRRAALAGTQQHELADRLVAARLAVADDTGSGETLRLAHEALLAHWPRLAELIVEYHDLLVVRRRLQGDAASWENHGRHDDFLLPAGRRLAEAEDVLAKHRGDLDPEIIVYAEASVALESARAAAAQREKEEALRRELRRSRRVAAIVSVLLLASIAAGIFAWIERDIAAVALLDVEKNYQLALDQAAGSVKLLVDSYDEGAISTKLMRQLIEQAQKTVNGLPGKTDEMTVAQVKLLDVMSLAYVSVNGVATARQFAENENELADGLIRKSASDPRWMRLWAQARGRLSDALYWQGDLDRAVQQARAGEEVAIKFAGMAADDEDSQWQLILAYQRVGDELRAQGEFDSAAREYQAWLDHASRLREKQPGNLLWLRGMAFAYQRLGDNLQIEGKPAEAEARYRQYLSLITEFAAAAPQNAMSVEGLAVSHERLGDALLAEDDGSGAEAEYRLFQGFATRLSDIDTSNFRWREFLASTYQRIGDALMQQKNYAGALEQYQTYLSISDSMLAKDPSNSAILYDVANAHEKIGDALRQQANLIGALKEYQADMEFSIQLASKDASNATWQKSLATSHQRLGMVLKAQGDTIGALAQFRQCVEAPIKAKIWSPRSMWPPMVHEYCQQEAVSLSGSVP